jgi:uncharacterized protein DUF6011
MDARRFILAGNATFTVVSAKTGTRFTYRIRAKEIEGGRTLHFVSVLTGADNESDYTFLGTVFEGKTFKHSPRSHIGIDAPSARAFKWSFERIMGDGLGTDASVHHEGKCGRCGRKLTVPESIELGLGPECANA